MSGLNGLPVSPADWTVRVLDLDGVEDKAAFMDRCATALALPAWFGRNWDALADALGDPGQLPAAEGAPVLVVRGWDRFEERQPAQWEIAREVFAQASAVTVLLALG
ncbi:barstar family protein [Streptomyces sp. SID14478]|uniref:barstar family protein n=1 Tax=Streptomyces sp. SID14478 TaxID=2706073 RepID=UPI0013D9A9CA|nr:barstar family protein [Streptomyces sp. SID14478]NEB78829.1 barstar family protein [Streptomyces sp. SID14478]